MSIRLPLGRLAGACLLSLAAASLEAQAVEQVAFVVRRGTDTLVVERVRRSAARLETALRPRERPVEFATVGLSAQGGVSSIV
ncbi:MAG TPA: hypothetical protein VEA99_14725, partial [Gemmatimonadaceae bacterium]|nr:hypothetical protein [Gemmatimonadaceae bacterium]